jgi:hypothetical protein
MQPAHCRAAWSRVSSWRREPQDHRAQLAGDRTHTGRARTGSLWCSLDLDSRLSDIVFIGWDLIVREVQADPVIQSGPFPERNRRWWPCRRSHPLVGLCVLDIDLLGDLYRVIDLDAKITNRVFYLQYRAKLDPSEVRGAAGRSVLPSSAVPFACRTCGIKFDGRDPVFTSRAYCRVDSSREPSLERPIRSDRASCRVLVERIANLTVGSNLTGLPVPLSHCRAIERMTVRRHVINPGCDTSWPCNLLPIARLTSASPACALDL